MNRSIRTVLCASLLAVLTLAAGVATQPASNYSAAAATAKTYYVDCNGSDGRSGLSASTAWKSLDKLKTLALAPGDGLLFKRGCVWSGSVNLKWTGTASAPIQIGAYGAGALPTIAHAPSTNVYISGAYQVISDLATQHSLADYATVASDGQPYGWKVGFNFYAGAHHNTLQRVRTSGHAAGVAFTDNTHDNRVLSSEIVNNTGMWSDTTDATGVLLHGTNNEIAYNTFSGNVALKRPNKSISLEVFNSVGGNVHHNTSTDRVFAELGSGAITSKDNTFAYNEHNSRYQPQGDAKGAIFLVTVGSGCNFGPVWNTVLYNNTVYLPGEGSQGVVASCSGPAVLTMKNNIFVTSVKAWYLGGGATEDHNVVWPVGGMPLPNNFVQGPALNNTSQVAAPQFVNAGSGNFQLQAGSPAVNAGSQASVNAGYVKDMANVPVPQGGAVDVGSYERAASTEGVSPSVHAVPGRIEAEDYNAGGEGVEYHDTTPGNAGGAYRQDDVDIQPTSDTGGGFNLAWIAAGEWLRYDIKVQTAGSYVFKIRVAAPSTGGTFRLKVDGSNVTGVVNAPNTGGWQNWQTVTTAPVALSAGTHTLRFDVLTDGFNLNFLEVRTP